MKLLSNRDCEILECGLDKLCELISDEHLYWKDWQRILWEVRESIASQDDPIDNWYRQEAEYYSREGDCEVDDGAVVSRCDIQDSCGRIGAYVMSWTWTEGPAPQQLSELSRLISATAEEMGITVEDLGEDFFGFEVREGDTFQDVIEANLDFTYFDIDNWKSDFTAYLSKKEAAL